MKLKSLNCQNCGNPLREADGKLHCDVCGSVFDLDVSFETKQMEHIQKSIENAEASIEADKRALEEFQRAKEEAEIEAERQQKARLEEMMRPIRRRSLMHSIRTVVITLVISAVVIVGMIILLKNLDVSSKSKKKQSTTQTEVAKNYRITPSELKGAGAFLEELSEKTIEMIKKDHDGSVYESTDDTLYIWNRTDDLQVTHYYLLTREDRNYLYMLIAMQMKGANNSPNSDEVLDKEVYVMAYVENVVISEDGKVTYRDDKIKTDGSSKYNYMWHVDFDKEILVDELVNAKVNDEEKPYLLHEFTV